MSKEGFKGPKVFYSRVQGSTRSIKEELESYLLMNVCDLRVRDMDVGMIDLTKGGDQLRVLDITYDAEPLRTKIEGVVSGEVDTKYNPPSFIMEVNMYTIERLLELEKLYVRNHPTVSTHYKFRSCIIDDKYIRVKLRAGKLGRQFQFTSNRHNFRPSSVKDIFNGMDLRLTVDPKFYFSKEHYGMFLQVHHVEFP